MAKQVKEVKEIEIGDYVKYGDQYEIVTALSPAYIQVTSKKEEEIKSPEDFKDPEFLKSCYWVNRNAIKVVKETINIFKK